MFARYKKMLAAQKRANEMWGSCALTTEQMLEDAAEDRRVLKEILIEDIAASWETIEQDISIYGDIVQRQMLHAVQQEVRLLYRSKEDITPKRVMSQMYSNDRIVRSLGLAARKNKIPVPIKVPKVQHFAVLQKLPLIREFKLPEPEEVQEAKTPRVVRGRTGAKIAPVRGEKKVSEPKVQKPKKTPVKGRENATVAFRKEVQAEQAPWWAVLLSRIAEVLETARLKEGARMAPTGLGAMHTEEVKVS